MTTAIPEAVRSGLVAEVDMSGDTFAWRFLKLGTAAGQANRCGATTDNVIGVLTNRPKAGFAVSFMRNGKAQVVAGGAVARTDYVYTDNQGRAVTDNTSGNRSAGVAMTAAANAGEVIEVDLRIGSRVP